MRRFFLGALSALLAFAPILAHPEAKLKQFQIEDFELAMQGPAARAVFLVKDNTFLNTTSKNPRLLEKLSELAFSPVHYLFQGQYVSEDAETSETLSESVFKYREPSHLKTWLSVALVPASILTGSLFKGLALTIHKETRETLRLATQAQLSTTPPTKPNYPVREKLGLEPFCEASPACLELPRGPLVHPEIKDDIEALKAIAHCLKTYNIPFWLDDGTCLGAYRHAGVIAWDHDVDMSILKPDFENARKALSSLDRSLYELQDWSGDCCPGTYLRVLVKSNSSLIDIYTYDIDLEKNEVRYIYALEDSLFVPKKWKDRERKLTSPKPAAWLFPLKKICFDGAYVYVPNETEKWLQSKYGPDISPAKVWSVDKEMYLKVEGHPYWKNNTI